MAQHSRVTSRKPSFAKIRERTNDARVCNKEVRQGRALKNSSMHEPKAPTHIGVRRFLTSASVGLVKEAMHEGPKREGEKNRLMNTDIGKIVVASAMRLDVIESHPIKDSSYAKGLLDAFVMMRLSAEGPPAVAVEADILGIDINQSGHFIMSVDSRNIRNERYSFGTVMRGAVPATKHIQKDSPLEIVIGRYKFDEESDLKFAEGREPLNPDEKLQLTSGIYDALARSQAHTSDPKPVIQFQPWEFTKGFERAVQSCAQNRST